MELLHTIAELTAWRRQPGGPVHFVPTMGALHRGHQQLIRRAGEPRGACLPRVLVSVFVNPLQFAPHEDFGRYPRDLEHDAQQAAAAGATALFAPSVAEIYPHGSDQLCRVLPPPALLESLCARSRPGHFEGVATVVVRLLGLVQPGRLLLGEKDWQQLVILRRVVADLALPVVVEGCVTVRDADGLACSSRNRYLDAQQRRQAAALPAALAAAARAWQEAGGGRSIDLESQLRRELQVAALAVDYVELVGAHSLRPLAIDSGLSAAGPVLLAAAVHCGPSRLIDHLVLMSRPPIVAIDGPAGAGKSTVTRAFAERLGLIYLDTGAMYRAVTWLVLTSGIDPADGMAVAPLLAGLKLQLGGGAGGGVQVSVNGCDVSEAIRSPEVTAQVSVVAAHPCVRAALTEQQQAIGARGGLVAEGRDIGTAVFPDAELKVFLTATPGERARRRALDLEQRGFAAPPLAELEAQILDRDHRDASRDVAPLTRAPDAVDVVTDGLSIEEVIQQLLDLFRARVPEEAWPGPGAQRERRASSSP